MSTRRDSSLRVSFDHGTYAGIWRKETKEESNLFSSLRSEWKSFWNGRNFLRSFSIRSNPWGFLHVILIVFARALSSNASIWFDTRAKRMLFEIYLFFLDDYYFNDLLRALISFNSFDLSYSTEFINDLSIFYLDSCLTLLVWSTTVTFHYFDSLTQSWKSNQLNISKSYFKWLLKWLNNIYS